jgi:hypothetical protein
VTDERDTALNQYRQLMSRIRARFEIIAALGLQSSSDLAELETAAFHLRKIIEGIAFACLVALRNGLKSIPRDAVGQWNADVIFAKLSKSNNLSLPCPVIQGPPKAGADPKVKFHFSDDTANDLTLDQLRSIYRNTHPWLHEWNPYVQLHVKEFPRRRAQLIRDCQRAWDYLAFHAIHIAGKVFIGVLKNAEGHVQVFAAEAVS